MYWLRNRVLWGRNSKLLGKQQNDSKPIDFANQRGVYILYNDHKVIYVGRSVDRPIAQRLNEHTTDRLSGRWNRFSWFGLSEPNDSGELLEPHYTPTVESLIVTLEALLIESMEPALNRRRGDDLSGLEYLQAVDPLLEKQHKANLLRELMGQLHKT